MANLDVSRARLYRINERIFEIDGETSQTPMTPETTSQLLALAQRWRLGADNVRRQFRTASGVPMAAEAAAETREICAKEIEELVKEGK